MTVAEGEDLDSLFREYVEVRRVGGVKETTVECIERALRDFGAFLSRKGVGDLAAVDEKLVQEYLAEVLERSGTRAYLSRPWEYMNSYAYRLRPFFSWAVKTGRILVHPLLADERPRLPKRLPKANLTPEEVRRLLEAPDVRTNAGIRDRAILEVLYSSALRRNELVKLDLRDWDATVRTAHIREAKGGKDRMVPVGEVAAQWMGRYLVEARPLLEVSSSEQAIFLSRSGERIQPCHLTTVGTRYSKAAGLGNRATPHRLRHACAAHLVEAGVDLRYVQMLLGHEGIETTEVYTQLTQAEVAGAHRRFHPRGGGVVPA